MNTKNQTKPNIKPLGDRLLIKCNEDGEQIQGGIIIPDAVKDKSQEAEIVAIGSGKLDENGKPQPFSVNVGDTVIINHNTGTILRIGGEEYKLIHEYEIMGVYIKS